MHETTIGAFLDQLAARLPAPGGGATAALDAAQGAALLAMVARYTQGPKYAEHAHTVGVVLAEADRLRAECADLIAADASAFGSVAAAYRLPKDTAGQLADRSAAVATALITAAEPPAAVIAAAAKLIDLAETLLPLANRSVVTDVAAAAQAIRSAAGSARINVEVNRAGVTDAAASERLTAAISGVDQLMERADLITADVRAGLAR
jgi:formiminotetrahydrofolate cyclodeaminase